MGEAYAPRSGCPINATIEVFGDRWSPLVLRDTVFGDRRYFRELQAGSEEGIASHILADRLKRLVELGLLTRQDPRAGQRARYSLTEPAIQLVPVFAQLGSSGLRQRPTSRALRVRAELLEQGGPALWQEFMDELRRSHLGSESPARSPSVREGPVLVEYYAGTEGNGMTAIDSGTWLTKPGTVGRAVSGTIRICADDGKLPAGQTGVVYFETDEIPFAYHNDPDKTRAAQHPARPTWTTLGDIGYLDDDGFLFLTDRKAFTIISGGVNIYPQEAENALALHPAIYDVAVVGVPDPEMGESVAAFVQPAPGAIAGPELEQEIIAFVKSKIASYKAPRTVRFVDALPRSEAGKLMKSELKARYAAGGIELEAVLQP